MWNSNDGRSEYFGLSLTELIGAQLEMDNMLKVEVEKQNKNIEPVPKA